MGFRNPFRFSVDPNTGWIGLADYAPDSGTDAPATRGPAGIVEYNLIKQPGNYGWPLCMGEQRAVPRRRLHDADPVTRRRLLRLRQPGQRLALNTGLTNLPPAQAPVMYYGYTKSSVPAVIPAGGGLAPMGGPFYDYDADLALRRQVPGVLRRQAVLLRVVEEPHLLDDARRRRARSSRRSTRFLPTESFLSPQDMKFGPDGALYTLEWGGGFGRDNPNSGIYRVDYINGSRSPIATRHGDARQRRRTPLTVSFDGSGVDATPRASRAQLRVGLRRRRDDRRDDADRDVHVHDAGRLQRAAHGHRPRRQVRHDGDPDHRRQHAPAGDASTGP